ncbi:hypothetical protein [Sphingomonas psychrotolerans]|uniref:hypothetical protein n=1 Tax=Sphingomonas psychrotolerans TaxID=1327635 RepID=UPI001F4164BA|nr:hypothetical protein [Sphingomonas psychrotolerans]
MWIKAQDAFVPAALHPTPPLHPACVRLLLKQSIAIRRDHRRGTMLEGTLLDRIAATVAVIAVASVGFMARSGRVERRRA